MALPGAAFATSPGDATQVLKHADSIKSADHKAFLDLLQRLDAGSASLSPYQQNYLRYLHAWQIAYTGDYASAIPALDAIINGTDDNTLRLRAGVTAVNLLAIASRNVDAYTRLNQLLDRLPSVADPDARAQALGVASLLYSQAGQYDLGQRYAEKFIAENWAGQGACKGSFLKLSAVYRSRIEHLGTGDFQDGIDACEKIGEKIFASQIRVLEAKLALDRSRPADAIRLLKDHYDEAQSSHFPPSISDFDSTLAQAYWKAGDAASAQLYASRAVTEAPTSQYTEALVGAYDLLYRISKKQGDMAAALGWHEKYSAADKGYLNDVSAHALAYQMVHQQVLEKKAQVAALSQQNQLLKLKQAVGRKNMIAVQLGVALLLVVLGSIVLYAYRTKRSQLKFQKLARRDGLTEIFNRQYFVECAERELAYCRKSVRDASLVAIDLDHFKLINDTHGHAAGDFALKRAVAACQKHLRSVDMFGRLGGEEFGILMPDCIPERAADVAEKMRAEIAALQASEEGPEFPVSASFGVTAARWSGYDLLQLLAQSDSALYQAKGEGRNRVVVSSAAGFVAGVPPGVPERRRA